MQWADFLGHERQIEWFRTALSGGRLATSFLFVGPEGVGKRTFALLLAKSLLCRQSRPADLAPCGACEDCAQVDASTHPDLIQLAKPPEKAFLPIELLIGEREKRMREGLCHDISLRPYGDRRKIAVLDDADSLNNEGANCLLKTLEEPPSDSVLILIGSSLQRQLPTIRSRCQAIVFKALEPQVLTTLILRSGITDSAALAQELVDQSGGSLSEARLLADPEVRSFRSALLESLSANQLPLVSLPKMCSAIADAAGKDARVKRDRMKLIFRLAASLYRGIALANSCDPVSTGTTSSTPAASQSVDELLDNAVGRAMSHWKGGVGGAIDCWQRCLLAIEQVDRNANQTGLLEAWVADLATMSLA